MYKNYKSKLIGLLLILFIGITNLKSQCVYVKNEVNFPQVSIVIPCDFPMFNYFNSTEEQKKDFEKEVVLWKTKNKGLESISFIPSSTLEHFEIELSVFNTFSSEKKAIVNAMPFFYKIIPTPSLIINKQ